MTAESANVPSDSPPPPLVLDGAAAAPKKLRGHYARLYSEYESIYGKGERTVKRWVARGKAASPIDLPPLDTPSAMPAWWRRCMAQEVPDYIARAAELHPAPVVAPDPPTAPAPDSPPAPAVAPTAASLDLSSMTVGEGDGVRWARQTAGAVYAKLHAAYLAGRDDEIRSWQPRWDKASQNLRQAEEADRVRQEKMRLLVSREAVSADVSEAIEMLKLMRDNMERRIEEKLPHLDPDLRARILFAIRQVREKEDLVFAQLPSLKPRTDVRALLAA